MASLKFQRAHAVASFVVFCGAALAQDPASVLPTDIVKVWGTGSDMGFLPTYRLPPGGSPHRGAFPLGTGVTIGPGPAPTFWIDVFPFITFEALRYPTDDYVSGEVFDGDGDANLVGYGVTTAGDDRPLVWFSEDPAINGGKYWLPATELDGIGRALDITGGAGKANVACGFQGSVGSPAPCAWSPVQAVHTPLGLSGSNPTGMATAIGPNQVIGGTDTGTNKPVIWLPDNGGWATGFTPSYWPVGWSGGIVDIQTPVGGTSYSALGYDGGDHPVVLHSGYNKAFSVDEPLGKPSQAMSLGVGTDYVSFVGNGPNALPYVWMGKFEGAGEGTVLRGAALDFAAFAEPGEANTPDGVTGYSGDLGGSGLNGKGTFITRKSPSWKNLASPAAMSVSPPAAWLNSSEPASFDYPDGLYGDVHNTGFSVEGGVRCAVTAENNLTVAQGGSRDFHIRATARTNLSGTVAAKLQLWNWATGAWDTVSTFSLGNRFKTFDAHRPAANYADYANGTQVRARFVMTLIQSMSGVPHLHLDQLRFIETT